MVAILPVLAVLLVGAELLGATTLQDYGLALFVGLLSGAYSSIFIAAPVLAMLKRKESRWLAIEHRLIARGGRTGDFSAADAATMSTQISAAAGGQTRGGGGGGGGGRGGAKSSGVIRPGSGAALTDRPSGGSGSGSGTGSVPGSSAGNGPGSGAQGPRPRKGKGKRRR